MATCYGDNNQQPVPQLSTSWHPSREDIIVLNVDRCCQGNPGLAGFGGLLRQGDGSWILGYFGYLGFADSLRADLSALYHGLEAAWSYGTHGFSFSHIRRWWFTWSPKECLHCIVMELWSVVLRSCSSKPGLSSCVTLGGRGTFWLTRLRRKGPLSVRLWFGLKSRWWRYGSCCREMLVVLRMCEGWMWEWLRTPFILFSIFLALIQKKRAFLS